MLAHTAINLCRSLAACLTLLALGSGCRMVSSGENMHGVQLYQQGYFDAASQKFLQALNADPRDADAYYNLAATHHQLWKARQNASDLAHAETLYNQCLDVSPDHRECNRALAVLLVEKGDQSAAFRLLNTWAGQSATPAEAKVELARLYEEFGDPREARNRLNEAIQLDPKNARALVALARLQEASGEAQQALTNYLRANQFDPNQPGVTHRIAALQTTLGGHPTSPLAHEPRMVAGMDRGLSRY
jgi:tetratricopeptide (TPR) repeat protein